MNFLCIRPTGLVCSVQGFHKSFKAIPEVPVATVATAWDDPDTSQTFILIIHQALYFGSQLDHSLINPNQIRVAGIGVCDDPFDRYRRIGIESEQTFIPFRTEGNTIYFESRVPTQTELDEKPYIVLTDDHDWDPTTTDLTDPIPKQIEEVEVNGDQISTEYNESAHYLASISSALTEGTLVNRIVKSVQINTIMQVASNSRHTNVTPEHVARSWGIGLDQAKETLRVTTQKGLRYAIHPIHRRYRVDHLQHLGLNVRRIVRQFYVDHMQAKVKSLSQNTGAFVYTTGSFTKVYPVIGTGKAGETLAEFARDVGVPTDLRADLAGYFTGNDSEFVKETKRLKIKVTYAEKGRHRQNHAAEREIRNLKRRWHNKMTTKRVPKRLWDYGLVHQGELMSRMARGGTCRMGYEDVIGETPDISEWLDFDFFDRIWYHDPPGTMAETTEEIRKLGRWLGVANRVGSALTYWVLTKAGKVIARSTIQHVTMQEELSEDIAQSIKLFDEMVTERLDDTNFVIDNMIHGENILQDEDFETDDPAYGDGSNTLTDAEYRMETKPPERKEEDEIETEAYDKFIGAQVTVDFGTDGQKRATVKKRVTDYEGNLVGRKNKNPLLDT
jgi:hypothetical protein